MIFRMKSSTLEGWGCGRPKNFGIFSTPPTLSPLDPPLQQDFQICSILYSFVSKMFSKSIFLIVIFQFASSHYVRSQRSLFLCFSSFVTARWSLTSYVYRSLRDVLRSLNLRSDHQVAFVCEHGFHTLYIHVLKNRTIDKTIQKTWMLHVQYELEFEFLI